MDDSEFEALCDRFEASWKNGDPLSIETILKSFDGEQDALFRALLEIELEYREGTRPTATPEEYEARFPLQQQSIARAFAATRERLEPTKGSLDETRFEAASGRQSQPTTVQSIGPYRILKSVGRGRSGHVFAATQAEPIERKVALKLLDGETEPREFLSKFERVRLKLGLVDHANIAPILDVGETETGTPFVVMEFVKGLSITKLCDHFTLNVKQRLQLFLQVCQAIQFGHLKGLVHGAIRPNKLLVTQSDGSPLVKVLELGLANLRSRDPLAGIELGGEKVSPLADLLSYTSPECFGKKLSDRDVGSDIYSLGALLYELLTGTTPIEPITLSKSESPLSWAAIRDIEIPSPSHRLQQLGERATTIASKRKTDPETLLRLLRGGLDRIVMKALDKQPTIRHDSVAELSDDIQNVLTNGRRIAESFSVGPTPATDRDAEAVTIAGELPESDAWPNMVQGSFQTILAPPVLPGEIGRLGEFKVTQLLGAGGMGFVFRATRESSEQTVALKVMKPAIELDPKAKQRFLREAFATKELKHPNIVETFEVNDFNGTPYLTMELLQGRSLQATIENGEPLSEARLIQIAKDVTAGLAFAHSRDLVHRDIKPSNLWVCDPTNAIKILDFGLVRDVSHDHVSLTETGVVLGSPKYMSPEQTRGEKVGFESDLFSLGSILYRLATGKDAFIGKNVTTTLLAIAKSEPTPISSLRPKLRAEISELIHCLLQKTPSHRPSSAMEVHSQMARLEDSIDGKGPKT
ncbi:MAG: serine/threonine-protein kinase [Planctomycetota bacterium]